MEVYTQTNLLLTYEKRLERTHTRIIDTGQGRQPQSTLSSVPQRPAVLSDTQEPQAISETLRSMTSFCINPGSDLTLEMLPEMAVDL